MGEKGICKFLYFLHFDLNFHISFLVIFLFVPHVPVSGFSSDVAAVVSSRRTSISLFFCFCCMCLSAMFAAI